MAIDSTAELLFNISANSDVAQANITKFRQVLATDLEFVSQEFEGFTSMAADEQAKLAAALNVATEAEHAQAAATEELAAAHGHAVSEIQATSGAIRLLEGSGGIRAMERFTVTTLGLGPALQAIFPIVGAIAFAEIITKMGEKVYAMVEQWNPVVQAEQRATEAAKALRDVIQKTGEEIQKLDLEAFTQAVGKPSAALYQADQIIRTKITADKQMIAGLLVQISEAEQLIVNSPVGKMSGLMSREAKAAQKDLETLHTQLSAFQMDLEKNQAEVSKLLTEGSNAQIAQNERTAETTKEATQNFFGLTSVLESLKSKVVSYGSDWDKLWNEVAHYNLEAAKAREELEKLQKAGTITGPSAQREMAALAQIPGMIARVIAEASEKIKAHETQVWGEAIVKQLDAQDEQERLAEKAGDVRVQVEREIADKLATSEAQSYGQQRARWIEQQNAWAASVARKTDLTAQEWNDIDQITADGLTKIDHAQETAWQQEQRKLQQHLDSLVAASSTGQQRIAATYQKDLQQYSEVELQKSLLTAKDETERAVIRQHYAQIISQLTKKYEIDLQTLRNSQGFQGVFGSYFQSLIRGNEQLLREWSQNASGSLLTFSRALQMVKQMSEQAFQTLAQGMGNSIVQAFMYEKSVGEAMRSALASTVESFAGQAAVAAIMSTGWGLYYLAMGAYPQAGNAFAAAAVFGGVGAVAAIAGKLIAPSQSTSGTAAPAAGTSTSGVSSASAGSSAATAGTPAPTVNVYVEGHVIGPNSGQMIVDMINQAVYSNDATLYASHNRQGNPL